MGCYPVVNPARRGYTVRTGSGGWVEGSAGFEREGLRGLSGGLSGIGEKKKFKNWIWKYGKSDIIFAPVLTTSLIKKG